MKETGLIVDKGVTIKEWMDYNINIHGAKGFFDLVNNCWNDKIADSVKESILDEIYLKIKPDKIESIDDLAKLLNDNMNGDELDNPYNIDVEKICKENKWIILFPYSDDCLEIRGYIDDEIGAWNGGDYEIIKKGDFYKDTDEENTYHKAERNMLIYGDENPGIKIKWCEKDNYVWYIDCTYDNVAYFNIQDEDVMDDNEIWARCCVIDCSKIL